MINKVIEVRDRATRIDVIATQLRADTWEEAHYFRRHGYTMGAVRNVVLSRLDSFESHVDPHEWINARTMREAHGWITRHFDEIISGQVVDVEFILGEVAEPKRPEREEVSV